jgi:hypothetical protein
MRRGLASESLLQWAMCAVNSTPLLLGDVGASLGRSMGYRGTATRQRKASSGTGDRTLHNGLLESASIQLRFQLGALCDSGFSHPPPFLRSEGMPWLDRHIQALGTEYKCGGTSNVHSEPLNSRHMGLNPWKVI